MSLASEELDYICLEYLVVEDFSGINFSYRIGRGDDLIV